MLWSSRRAAAGVPVRAGAGGASAGGAEHVIYFFFGAEKGVSLDGRCSIVGNCDCLLCSVLACPSYSMPAPGFA